MSGHRQYPKDCNYNSSWTHFIALACVKPLAIWLTWLQIRNNDSLSEALLSHLSLWNRENPREGCTFEDSNTSSMLRWTALTPLRPLWSGADLHIRKSKHNLFGKISTRHTVGQLETASIWVGLSAITCYNQKSQCQVHSEGLMTKRRTIPHSYRSLQGSTPHFTVPVWCGCLVMK